jgi:tetratricopeptide (TPR) repeat protein
MTSFFEPYTLIVTRRLWFAACLAVFTAAAQNPQAPPPQQIPDESTLPEEDESVAPEKFVLNPLESDRNVRVGDYYWHKGKYRAALKRYEWATKYNPSSAAAFYKVGEAEEKLKNADAAKLAFQKVITLAPDSKLAKDAKKKMSKS